MSIASSTSFSLNQNQIILAALQKIGMYGVGRTVSQDDFNVCQQALNRMVCHWQENQRLHIWAKTEAYLFIAPSTAQYTLGDDNNLGYAALRSNTCITTLSASAVTGATTISVANTTAANTPYTMQIGDNIGVVLSNGNTQWTTVSNISGNTITLGTALTSAANQGNNVYDFSTWINKPLRILSMRRCQGVDTATNWGTTIPLEMLSHQDYFDLPQKASNGYSTQYHYNPNVSDGTLYLWPRPLNSSIYFEFTYERMLNDFVNATDTPDFPQSWYDTLVYHLALRIAPDFGAEAKAGQLVLPQATDMLTQALDSDNEIGSIYICPDRR